MSTVTGPLKSVILTVAPMGINLNPKYPPASSEFTGLRIRGLGVQGLGFRGEGFGVEVLGVQD